MAKKKGPIISYDELKASYDEIVMDETLGNLQAEYQQTKEAVEKFYSYAEKILDAEIEEINKRYEE